MSEVEEEIFLQYLDEVRKIKHYIGAPGQEETDERRVVFGTSQGIRFLGVSDEIIYLLGVVSTQRTGL